MIALSVLHWVWGSPWQTPSPVLPDLSIFLPACVNMSAVPGRSGLLWPPSSTWALTSSTSRATPLHQHSCCFCGFWCFPHFPPGEEQFPNAGMEYKQKSHGLSSDRTTWGRAHGRKKDTSQYISLPPRPCLQTYKFLLDDQVSCISSSIFL